MELTDIYYVYRHVRLDKNEPFYIGIGNHISYNIPYSRAYCSRRRNKIWKLITNKTQYKVEILLDNLTKEQAFKKEIEFISLYKRLKEGGTLSNLTLGGEGTYGHTFRNNIEGKKNKSIAAKKRSKEIIDNKAKNFIIINPKNEIFKITNLDKFCKENNLSSSNLIKVALKRSKHHKKWRCYYENELSSNYFYFPKYKITHNNSSFITDDLVSFIKDNKLDRANVQKVLNNPNYKVKGFGIKIIL
jgi:hypothetical protein